MKREALEVLKVTGVIPKIVAFDDSLSVVRGINFVLFALLFPLRPPTGIELTRGK